MGSGCTAHRYAGTDDATDDTTGNSQPSRISSRKSLVGRLSVANLPSLRRSQVAAQVNDAGYGSASDDDEVWLPDPDAPPSVDHSGRLVVTSVEDLRGVHK